MNTPSFFPKGLLGHMLDLYRISSFDFINPHSYTKFRFINSIRKAVKADTLIEVGTYKGITTKRCSRVFDSVFTIELDHDLCMQSKNFLKNKNNVVVVEGAAERELPAILERNTGEAIVFLDGHFSGGETSCGDVPEPALSLLNYIAEYKHNVKAIVIDDFREFGFHGWPKKSELISAIEELFVSDGYKIFIHLDMVAVFKI